MIELLKKRRSIRSFTEQKIEKDKVGKLLRAGLLAPASWGRPVEFVVIEDRDMITGFTQCKNHSTTPFMTAPLAIVVLADSADSDVWVENASIAAILVQLEAEALGLGSTWVQIRLRQDKMGGSSEDAVREKLGIPPHYGVLCILAIGYKNEEKLPHQENELDPGKVHYGSFRG